MKAMNFLQLVQSPLQKKMACWSEMDRMNLPATFAAFTDMGLETADLERLRQLAPSRHDETLMVALILIRIHAERKFFAREKLLVWIRAQAPVSTEQENACSSVAEKLLEQDSAWILPCVQTKYF